MDKQSNSNYYKLFLCGHFRVKMTSTFLMMKIVMWMMAENEGFQNSEWNLQPIWYGKPGAGESESSTPYCPCRPNIIVKLSWNFIQTWYMSCYITTWYYKTECNWIYFFHSRHNPYGREQSERQAQTMNRASAEENSHGLFYDENNYFIGYHKLRWLSFVRISFVVYHTHFGATHKLSYKRKKCTFSTVYIAW